MTNRPVSHAMTATALTIDGYRSTKTLGVVRGVTVRSRSVFGTFGAALQTLAGGNITILTELCERTRAEAFDLIWLTPSSWERMRSWPSSTTPPR
jgi:uncharacterized protein YbjQ (UPF0145 family)